MACPVCREHLNVTLYRQRDDLDRLLTEKRVGIYAGVDPTAPSLHVGHLLPLMVLHWMYLHGFHACSLVGNPLPDSIGSIIDKCSLEVPRRRLAIPQDEHWPEKKSTPRYERPTCLRFICN